MATGPVIALIDGEHHPAVVRDALNRLEDERGLAGVVFCGGEEKVRREVLESPEAHYGRLVTTGEESDAALCRLAAETEARAVVDIADEPVVPPARKLFLASVALHLGLPYEAPGTRLDVPRYERVDFGGPKLALIGTGKRTGKTAVSGHWATLMRDDGARPVIVSMGRGGPPEPQLAPAGTSLDDLRRIAAEGRHAASDYLEDAALAGVAAVGCRRVGGGLAGEPFDSNVAEGGALAASQDADVLLFEGSGSCLPPVEVDRTVCIVGERSDALDHLGPYRLLRSDLALVLRGGAELQAAVREISPGRVMRCELRPEPAEEVPADARVAVFSTSSGAVEGLEPVISSPNLARRAALDGDLERARDERCDVYLTEIKAAAIDTVAERAEEAGARLIFLRNRPVGVDGDLDEALLEVYREAGGKRDA